MGQTTSPLEQLAAFGICILIGSVMTIGIQKYGQWKEKSSSSQG